MNFNDYRRTNKEDIYYLYCNLLEIEPEYEKITRSKMLKEISQYYQDPKNLLLNCTIKEVEYLYNLIHKIPQDYSPALITYLQSKLLIMNYIEWEVPEEIHSSIDEAYQRRKDEKLIQRDNELSFLLGMSRIHGIMPLQNLIMFSELFLQKNKEETVKLLTSKLALNYIEIGENEKGVMEIYFFEGFAGYDEMHEVIDHYWVVMPKVLEYEKYQEYFYYGYDRSKSWDCKLIHFVLEELKREALLPMLLKDIVLATDEHQYILNLFDKTGIKKELSHLLKQVRQSYPCIAFNGNTYSEYQELLEKEEKYIKAERRKMQPQRYACVKDQEADLFYECFFDLLDYINDEFHIEPSLSYNLKNKVGVEPAKLDKISSKYYENPAKYVEEFLADHVGKYNKKQLKVIEDFKKGRYYRGVLLGYKRDHTEIFTEDGLYAVKGLRCNLDEIIPVEDVPCMVEVGLQMFKGNIVFDGVIKNYPIEIGVNMLETIRTQASQLPLQYKLKQQTTNFINLIGEEEEEVKKLIIKKTKTDLLSSIKNLDKTYAKKHMEENYFDDYEEWAQDSLELFEMSFESSKDDPASIKFFNTLLINENTDNIVFPVDDVYSNIVFLYQENGKIKYYIPDEIKNRIKNGIKMNSKLS